MEIVLIAISGGDIWEDCRRDIAGIPKFPWEWHTLWEIYTPQVIIEAPKFPQQHVLLETPHPWELRGFSMKV